MARRIPGVAEDYSTGTDSVGSGAPPLAVRNADRASRVSASEPRQENFHRGRIEAGGARLTISPSMKTPVNAPEAQATMANARVVPSRQGRSNEDFEDEEMEWRR